MFVTKKILGRQKGQVENGKFKVTGLPMANISPVHWVDKGGLAGRIEDRRKPKNSLKNEFEGSAKG